jgi:hypothetical protein
MSDPRIAAGHTAPRPLDGSSWEVVGDKPLTYLEARDLLALALLLKRWHNVIDACDGDLEQARRVWAEVGRAENARAENAAAFLRGAAGRKA